MCYPHPVAATTAVWVVERGEGRGGGGGGGGGGGFPKAGKRGGGGCKGVQP